MLCMPLDQVRPEIFWSNPLNRMVILQYGKATGCSTTPHCVDTTTNYCSTYPRETFDALHSQLHPKGAQRKKNCSALLLQQNHILLHHGQCAKLNVMPSTVKNDGELCPSFAECFRNVSILDRKLALFCPNYQVNPRSSNWSRLSLLCSNSSYDGRSCTHHEKNIIQNLENGSLGCIHIRQSGGCSSLLGNSWGSLGENNKRDKLLTVERACTAFSSFQLNYSDNVGHYCACVAPLDVGCTSSHIRPRLMFEADAVILDPSVKEYTVTGLVPRSMYYLRVSAENDIGVGMARISPSQAPLIIPDRPQNVTVSLLSHCCNTRRQVSTSLRILFTSVPKDRTWVDHYLIQYSGLAKSLQKERIVDATSSATSYNVTLTDLNPGESYRVRVQAHITTYGHYQDAHPGASLRHCRYPTGY